MMKCINDEIFIKLENDLLDPIEQKQVMDHINSCKNCSALLDKEKEFDKSIRKSIKADNRIEGFANSILEKLTSKKEETFFGKLALAGGVIWCMAVFNSIAILILTLYMNDFSIAKIIVSSKDLLLNSYKFAEYFSIYLKAISTTLYMFLILITFMLLNLKLFIPKLIRP